jgi:hypothetical protein
MARNFEYPGHSKPDSQTTGPRRSVPASARPPPLLCASFRCFLPGRKLPLPLRPRLVSPPLVTPKPLPPRPQPAHLPPSIPSSRSGYGRPVPALRQAGPGVRVARRPAWPLSAAAALPRASREPGPSASPGAARSERRRALLRAFSRPAPSLGRLWSAAGPEERARHSAPMAMRWRAWGRTPLRAGTRRRACTVRSCLGGPRHHGDRFGQGVPGSGSRCGPGATLSRPGSRSLRWARPSRSAACCGSTAPNEHRAPRGQRRLAAAQERACRLMVFRHLAQPTHPGP